MTMPIIPALAGGAAATEPPAMGALTDLIEMMTEDEAAALLEAAAAWSAAGEPIPPSAAAAPPEEDSGIEEPGEGEPTEHVEDLAAEAAESPDEQAAEAEAGTENFDALLEQVVKAKDDAAASVEQLQSLREAAEAAEDHGGDPDAIDDLIKKAEKLSEEIEDSIEDAEAAAKDEDANGIAQAGLIAKEKADLLKALVTEAEVYAAMNTPPAENPETGEPVEEPALKLWASRYAV